MQDAVPFLDLAAMHREVGSAIDEAWREVVRTSSFVGGRFVERFEAEWAEFCGTKYCVGLSDGTAALELSLRALGVGPGAEVIVPANTFIATWAAVAAVGAQPVGVDVDAGMLLTTAQHIEAAVTSRTKAIIVVHLFGQPADMDAINRVAKRHGIAVIEDAAQAHGAEWKGKRAGALSDIGCFSFYPGKNLGALGDGGGVVTDRADLAETVRSLANHGRSKDSHDHHIHVGSNRRLDALQAALLSTKLPYLPRWNERRREIAACYAELLSGCEIARVEMATGATSSHHLEVVQVEDRGAVQRALADDGIATGIHYRTPCHQHPAFAGIAHRWMPVAESASERILSLPLFPHMTESQVKRVCASLVTATQKPRTMVSVSAWSSQAGGVLPQPLPAFGGEKR